MRSKKSLEPRPGEGLTINMVYSVLLVFPGTRQYLLSYDLQRRGSQPICQTYALCIYRAEGNEYGGGWNKGHEWGETWQQFVTVPCIKGIRQKPVIFIPLRQSFIYRRTYSLQTTQFIAFTYRTTFYSASTKYYFFKSFFIFSFKFRKCWTVQIY